MLQREPHETDETTTYYRLVPEGVFKDYDGQHQSAAPAFSLDLNRQFPYQWASEGTQAGAGSFPSHLPQASWGSTACRLRSASASASTRLRSAPTALRTACRGAPVGRRGSARLTELPARWTGPACVEGDQCPKQHMHYPDLPLLRPADPSPGGKLCRRPSRQGHLRRREPPGHSSHGSITFVPSYRAAG